MAQRLDDDDPVLVSRVEGTTLIDQVRGAATKTITVEWTGMGFRFESETTRRPLTWR